VLTAGSLFAGIGGFELGLEQTGGFKTIWQVEINDFCNKVLAKHWPDVRRYRDVCEFAKENIDEIERPDLICGGFPCQDISVASHKERRGLDGERSGLWAEFARVLSVLRPRYALIENSPNLVNIGLDRVLGDLASMGYDAEWFCLRASAVGAVHRRERLFACAYANSDGLQRGDEETSKGRLITSESAQTLGETLDWPAIRTPFGCRSSDGIPDRVERTRALGNAVVPACARWIGEQILNREAVLTAKEE
jgi:DNA (cytosine-5)-methyltransferase 1